MDAKRFLQSKKLYSLGWPLRTQAGSSLALLPLLIGNAAFAGAGRPGLRCCGAM